MNLANNPIISCQNISHTYKDKLVLENLSFEIERGGIFGLLGKNGAGKSTTINILMGFLRPSHGKCFVLGEESFSLSPFTKSKIGLLHEGFIQYDFMSIAELEKYYSVFYEHWDKNIFFGLVDKLNIPYSRKISQMSCGQRSQVVLGLIMAQKPELMLLDDYSMGLDVGYRRLFIEFLREYVQEYKTTVMLTSHVVQELDQIIDNMIVLSSGKVLVSCTKEEFMNSFFCYKFLRTEKSEVLKVSSVINNVEHFGTNSTIYSFYNEKQILEHLNTLGIVPDDFSCIPMGFEDAFVGLTGKY